MHGRFSPFTVCFPLSGSSRLVTTTKWREEERHEHYNLSLGGGGRGVVVSVLLITLAPRHEDVWEWRHNSTILNLGT
jgi:hypothetical protein